MEIPEVHAWQEKEGHGYHTPSSYIVRDPKRRYAAFTRAASGDIEKAAYAEVTPAWIRHIHTPGEGEDFWKSSYGRKLSEDEHFQETGNAPLWFEEEQTPVQLTMLKSTENSPRVVHTLLGVVGHQERKKHGVLPQADSTLTDDSAKIVQKLTNKGVLTPNPLNPTGESRLWNIPHITHPKASLDYYGLGEAQGAREDSTRVSDIDVRLGQQFATDAMRGRLGSE